MSAMAWCELLAKVPDACKRTTNTLNTLLKIQKNIKELEFNI